MAMFKVVRDAPLRSAPSLSASTLGSGPIPAGTSIEGDEQAGFVRATVVSVSPQQGFVFALGFLQRIDRPAGTPEPIATQDDVDAFLALVTRSARDASTDRDYLMAVAYCESDRLTNMGSAGSDRVGPFRIGAEAWRAAIGPGGVAAGRGLLEEDRLLWNAQPEVAALMAAQANKKLSEALGRPPNFSELYFAQLFGAGAADVLRRPRTDLCRTAIAAPAAGSFAAGLAAGDRTIAAALTELEGKLTGAYAEALKVIDRAPPDVRFFRAGDGDPPWLAVARNEMRRGVSETPDARNSADIKVYLKACNLDDLPGNTPWCAAFLAWCVRETGVEALRKSLQVPAAAGAGWWANWGQAATDPLAAGTVAVIRDRTTGQAGHVGLIIEGSDATTIKLLGGNQGGGGGPDKVGVVSFPAADVVARRWFEVAEQADASGLDSNALRRAGVKTGPHDALFVAKAPSVMRDLMRDLPGLSEIQAAAILGNIGHECGGFRELHQIGMPESKGGHGWCQWDGSRRDSFLAFAAAAGQDWRSDKANYDFLVHELRGPEAASLAALKRVDGLEPATELFDRLFERSGVKNLPSRFRYARLALESFRA